MKPCLGDCDEFDAEGTFAFVLVPLHGVTPKQVERERHQVARNGSLQHQLVRRSAGPTQFSRVPQMAVANS